MDIAEELGAQEGFSTQRLCLYIPDKDRDGRQLPDHETWVKAAREVLSRIGGGATALPPADGTWERDSGEILWEKTQLIYCFIDAERFVANMKVLRTFVHRFGRETNQGEVIVEFDGKLFRINKYDE